MKNAGMAGAVALVGIGLITIGMSNFANRAEAVPSVAASAGPGEPVIVAFDDFTYFSSGGFWRLWSDGTIEVRLLNLVSDDEALCDGNLIDEKNCGFGLIPFDTGWLTLPEPPGGNGFACRSDINGDRNIDAEDLGLLLAGWGQEISCDPQPSYPCFDLDGLNGLNMNIAAR